MGFCFSRNIGKVTPKINYFHNLHKVSSGSKYPENITFDWENRSTGAHVRVYVADEPADQWFTGN